MPTAQKTLTPPRTCPRCGGTGSDIDHQAIGAVLSTRRMKMGKQAKDVASLMGVTPWKLCKLEKGNRNWTEELISAYEDALNDITK